MLRERPRLPDDSVKDAVVAWHSVVVNVVLFEEMRHAGSLAISIDSSDPIQFHQPTTAFPGLLTTSN